MDLLWLFEYVVRLPKAGRPPQPADRIEPVYNRRRALRVLRRYRNSIAVMLLAFFLLLYMWRRSMENGNRDVFEDEFEGDVYDTALSGERPSRKWLTLACCLGLVTGLLYICNKSVRAGQRANQYILVPMYRLATSRHCVLWCTMLWALGVGGCLWLALLG